jgi:dienelactone hydrolase
MRPLALLIAMAFAAACRAAPIHPVQKATTVAAPAGAESFAVEWRAVHPPGLGTILMAVARPAGQGPFPAVIILHGSHGFAREYVQLAKDLSQDGVVGVAVCWFAPGEGPGMSVISPLACPPEAPRISGHQSQGAGRTIAAAVAAVRALPGVKSDQIAVFGHSRGGGAAWNYVLHGGKAGAVILNSAGYPDELIEAAAQFDAPVLILHGENDTVGPMTKVQRARLFEAALRQAGKSVEAVYYPNGEHGSLFVSPSQRADEVKRMKAFLRQNLRRN